MGELMDLEDLKQRVNNFLWTALPPTTSLADAERLALEFYGRIVKEWRDRQVTERIGGRGRVSDQVEASATP